MTSGRWSEELIGEMRHPPMSEKRPGRRRKPGLKGLLAFCRYSCALAHQRVMTCQTGPLNLSGCCRERWLDLWEGNLDVWR